MATLSQIERPTKLLNSRPELAEWHRKADPMPSSFGALYKVPPEIRRYIYREIVLAGSVRFLEFSRDILNEAIAIVRKESVCRLEFNACKSLSVFPKEEIVKNMLNVDIRINMTNHALNQSAVSSTFIDDVNYWMVRLTGGKYDSIFGSKPAAQPTPRESCKILLDFNEGFDGNLPTDLLDMMRFLTGFAKIQLAIANDCPLEPVDRLFARKNDHRPDPQRDMESAMHSKENEETLRAYGQARDALEPTLGPAKWVCDEKGAHLEFRSHAKDGVKE